MKLAMLEFEEATEVLKSQIDFITSHEQSFLDKHIRHHIAFEPEYLYIKGLSFSDTHIYVRVVYGKDRLMTVYVQHKTYLDWVVSVVDEENNRLG